MPEQENLTMLADLDIGIQAAGKNERRLKNEKIN